ncbi:MAG: FAD-dependent oxidoreductase [Bdellovibrionales bacterium]|nr:FAD-dependent oxidoreductase [Bdellovibrionales bacterium]
MGEKIAGKKFATLIGVFILALLVYLLLPAEYTSLEALKSERESLQQFATENLLLAGGIYFAIYILVTSLSLPGAAVLTLAGGAIFGLVYGTLIVSFASTIGATIAFLLSRFLFRDSVESKFPSAIDKIDRGIKREGAFYLFALRLVPAFPFFLINLVMGITGFSTATFFWVSQLGMLPGTVAYVYAGTQLAQLSALDDIFSPGLVAAFLILAALPLVSKWAINFFKVRKLYARFNRPQNTEYNIIVIGAGSAGLVTAYIAAAVKAKVALVEKHRMGGDCLNTGCVPSKALIRSAKAIHEIKNAGAFGIESSAGQVDFAQVMERVQSIIQKIAPHDSVERYTELGVECFSGEAQILDPFRVKVGEQVLTTQNIVVASGAHPFVPDYPGLEKVPFYTSDTIWQLRDQPKRMLVLGGGPIGSELAQAFHRLGSEVSIIERGSSILHKEDALASQTVMDQFNKEGIAVYCNHELVSFKTTNGEHFALCNAANGEVQIPFDIVLVALGRKANTSGFGLEELGVVIEKNGTIGADEFLRTNYPNLFVCGDVAGPLQFTHFGAHQAWYAAVNALLQPFKKFRTDYRVIPRTTFTDPEVAQVGLTEEEAKKKKIHVTVSTYQLDDLDRAITDGETAGFVKVITRTGSDEILGVTIVGSHASELLAEYVLAMKHRIGLNKILGTIHTYPTFSEANKYVAGVWKRQTKPEWALPYLERFHRWRRS